MTKIISVIPTYNEADNLEKITAALLALPLPGLEILVVDDASPDGTGQIADRMAQVHPGHFHVLHRAGKQGLGTAYIQGFQMALAQGAEYVIQMDADFSHNPEYLPVLLQAMPEYDVVVGSRYVPGGSTDRRWSWWRRFLSWWANSVWVRWSLGVKTQDATAGFKCWRAQALRQIDLETVRSTGYIFQVEMCYAAEQYGLRICEVPIYFEDRRIGKSKLSLKVKLEAALRVFEIRRRRGPLKKSPIHG